MIATQITSSTRIIVIMTQPCDSWVPTHILIDDDQL